MCMLNHLSWILRLICFHHWNSILDWGWVYLDWDKVIFRLVLAQVNSSTKLVIGNSKIHFPYNATVHPEPFPSFIHDSLKFLHHNNSNFRYSQRPPYAWQKPKPIPGKKVLSVVLIALTMIIIIQIIIILHHIYIALFSSQRRLLITVSHSHAIMKFQMIHFGYKFTGL